MNKNQKDKLITVNSGCQAFLLCKLIQNVGNYKLGFIKIEKLKTCFWNDRHFEVSL